MTPRVVLTGHPGILFLLIGLHLALTYQTPPDVTRLPQRQGNASRDRGGTSFDQSVMETSGDDSSPPGVGRLPNNLPAGRPVFRHTPNMITT